MISGELVYNAQLEIVRFHSPEHQPEKWIKLREDPMLVDDPAVVFRDGDLIGDGQSTTTSRSYQMVLPQV